MTGAVIVPFYNSSGVEWTEHLTRFQNETSVFKFLWRNVDEALESELLRLLVSRMPRKVIVQRKEIK